VGSTLGLVPPNDKIYIKRVVGVPGDRVVCCDSSNRITVNGAPLEEKDYLFPDDRPSDRPFDVTVPAGRIFVLGDHRAMSADSREHLEVANGTVPIDKVVGRAFVVIWPLGNWSGMGRPPTYEQERLSGALPAAPHGRRT
jgi:signal peptidase I